MNKFKRLKVNKEFRRKRNRAKISGTAEKPRLSIFRSNNFTYAQLIDDEQGKTLAAASTKEMTGKKLKRIEAAKALGTAIAEKAEKLGIKSAVFNKGPYLYHGRIKAVAEGAREKGLKI